MRTRLGGPSVSASVPLCQLTLDEPEPERLQLHEVSREHALQAAALVAVVRGRIPLPRWRGGGALEIFHGRAALRRHRRRAGTRAWDSAKTTLISPGSSGS